MEQAREHREERRGGTKAQNFIRDKGDPRLYTVMTTRVHIQSKSKYKNKNSVKRKAAVRAGRQSRRRRRRRSESGQRFLPGNLGKGDGEGTAGGAAQASSVQGRRICPASGVGVGGGREIGRPPRDESGRRDNVSLCLRG